MQSMAVYPAVPILAADFAAIPSGRGRAQSALTPEMISIRKTGSDMFDQIAIRVYFGEA